MSTTLSTIIPARNAAETLVATLESLLAQIRGDWEAIIVDDGSTDATRGIAQGYVGRDRRFRLLSDGRPSEGQSAARNRGIAAAKGRWLHFLDADDWIEPAFVDRMIGTLETHPGTRVAYCRARYVSPDGRYGPAWLNADVAETPFEILARRCPIVIHAVVVDPALVTDVGGFDASLRSSEDWDLWQRIARTGVAFLPVDAPLALYRMRPDSLSTDMQSAMADFRTVIKRAFGPDPRVRQPAAAHAKGADPELGSLERTVGQFALWCAAFSVGAGGTGKDRLLAPLLDLGGDLVETCRTTILDGLRRGALVHPGDRIGEGSYFVEAVRNLLAEVERAAARPGLARSLDFLLEPEVFRPDRLTERIDVDRVRFVRLAVAKLQPVEVTAAIDTLNIEFRSDTELLAQVVTPVFATMSVRELTAVAIQAMGTSVFLENSGLLWQPMFWLRLVLSTLRLPLDLRHARPRRGPRSVFRLRALAQRVTSTAILAAAGPRNGSDADRALARLIDCDRAQLTAPDVDPPPVEDPSVPWRQEYASPAGRRLYWEEIYKTPDPWAYGSAYEQLKYRRTLELVPDGSVARAVELACSEGRFTEMLAARVERLTAIDISATALDRARTRCRSLANVDFKHLDFFLEELPGDLDLLVCSEALYHLADRAQLATVATKLAASLARGGRLLTANLLLLKDDPSRSGFDSEMPFGGKVIAETLATVPELALERSLQTELYRVDLFRRLKDGEAPAPTIVEVVDLGPPPEPAHARDVVWGGAEARRTDVQARETTERLPILAYHRIADDGPPGLMRYRVTAAAFAEQMRWLRRHGYHAITSADVAPQLAGGRPFRGRPVMITFDDGYRDFHEIAWPILLAHDFRAEVMVVTDRIGGTADWDAGYGPPAPLMDWPEIRSLAAAGIRFGSHLASHRHMAEMTSREIVREAAQSRALIERVLGCDCRSIAAPFGEADNRFIRIAEACGYEIGLTTEPGFAHIGNDPMQLPRIQVAAEWSLAAFANAVRPARI